MAQDNAVREISAEYLVAVDAVPVGYKKTEVGVIPEDWGVNPLSLLLAERPKYGINAPAVPLQGHLPVYLRITDITDDGYFRASEKVGVNSPFSGFYKLVDGDIVLARTGASVGKSYQYKSSDGELIYAGFLIRVRPNKSALNATFLSQYFKSARYWSWVHVNSMRSGQPGINGNEYGQLLVPTPELKEQTAIATALSDVDALITSLEKLIAKKQSIKTATMQQLLTGKTRLPQFALREDGTPKGFKQSELGEVPEDWRVVGLLEKAELIHGKAHEPFVSDVGAYVVVNSKFVSSNGRVRKFCSRNLCVARVGDVLMVLSDLPNGKALAKCYYADAIDIYAVNQRVCIFRTHIMDSKYLFFILNRHEYFLALDDGVTQTHILNGDISMCVLCVPEARDEQAAIATILSDMDTEIQTLQQRLHKTRQIKQGMMQELLTGKTRLI